MKIRGYEIVDIRVNKYSVNNNTAVEFLCLDGVITSLFAVVTVNFDEVLPKDMAYLDTNNCPWVVDIFKQYNLGEPMGVFRTSGFCKYPLYKLNLKELEKFGY